MTRRTYHLPPHLDHALTKHAEARDTNPSAVVRDALTTYLVIEGNTQRTNVELSALRDELRAGLQSMSEQLARVAVAPKSVGVNEMTDRVRARFEQLTHKE